MSRWLFDSREYLQESVTLQVTLLFLCLRARCCFKCLHYADQDLLDKDQLGLEYLGTDCDP